MSDILEVKKRLNQIQSYISVGLSVGDTIKSGLGKFIDSIKDFADSKRNPSLYETLKELQGKEYKDESKFFLMSKYNGKTDFTKTAVSKEELNEFKKLCKEYGVDFLYQKRPDNLNELLNRKLEGKSLLNDQEKTLKAFSYIDDKGDIKLTNDSAMITFATKDLDAVDRIVQKLEERALTLEQRKIKATEKYNKIQKQKKEKTLSKKKELVK